MANLSEMGIQVVESEEAEDGRGAGRQGRGRPRRKSEEAGGNVDEESLGRTDDPVRMYLREMGSVELLSREGEIAIAKRIEAGRDMMIGGLCESPLTFRAIIAWHDALKGGAHAAARHHRPGGDPGRPDRRRGRGRPGAPPHAAARRRASGEPSRLRAGRPRTTRSRKARAPACRSRRWRRSSSPRCSPPSRRSRASTRSCTRCSRSAWRRMTSGEDVNAALREGLREAARGTGPQGRAGAAAQQPHRGAGDAAQAAQPAADRAGRPAAAHGRKLQGARATSSSTSTAATSSTRTGWSGSAELPGKALEAVRRPGTPSDIGQVRGADRRGGDRCRPADRRVPPRLCHRQPRRARYRARQEGDDRGQPAAGDLDRQEIHQSRAAIPGPDPGGQHRPDEGGGQVRVSPRLQVFAPMPPGGSARRSRAASPTRRAPSASPCT